jgi:Kef-type K+ transport system membrane component KefB
LGYLFAGVVIGPFCFGLVGTEGQDVMHVAEFGVVMMLFVIGLELRPAILWHMRGPISRRMIAGNVCRSSCSILKLVIVEYEGQRGLQIRAPTIRAIELWMPAAFAV